MADANEQLSKVAKENLRRAKYGLSRVDLTVNSAFIRYSHNRVA